MGTTKTTAADHAARCNADPGHRAAVLALNAARNFLACLDEGRKPGRRAARKALALVTKAHGQNVRAVALMGAL